MDKNSLFKILVAGDGGVGKTTLLHKYATKKFLEKTKMTVGIDFHEKKILFNNKEYSLVLWDFGGQEHFQFLSKDYIKGAEGALIMIDLTRLNTLNNISKWVEILRSNDPNLPILLVGTKIDLSPQFQDDLINIIIDSHNLFDYIKLSSKTGENVDKCFNMLTEKIINSQNKNLFQIV